VGFESAILGHAPSSSVPFARLKFFRKDYAARIGPQPLEGTGNLFATLNRKQGRVAYQQSETIISKKSAI